jgi:hypothetical protein
MTTPTTPTADTTATELLGAHTHHLAGADTLCSELTHCPSLCACAVDACDAQRVTFERVALADAQPGDQIWSAGDWVTVAAFHLFGSRNDLVKIVFPSGGSQAMPQSHCPTIRRAVATITGAQA